jgi:hypothetical protein
MTQFSALRQVFENFLVLQDHSINLFVALVWLLSKTSFVCSEALDYGTAFKALASFLKALWKFRASSPG